MVQNTNMGQSSMPQNMSGPNPMAQNMGPSPMGQNMGPGPMPQNLGPSPMGQQQNLGPSMGQNLGPSPMAQQQQNLGPSPMVVQQQQNVGPSPAPASTTSWAAAAGKGLPPSEPSQAHGATNKQLEQLNSVREALFSQVDRYI